MNGERPRRGATEGHTLAHGHTHTHTHTITHHNTKTQPIPHRLASSRGALPVCYWSTLLWVSPGLIKRDKEVSRSHFFSRLYENPRILLMG